MNAWEETDLETVTTKIGDGLHGTPKYDVNGDIFFINGNNLSNGKIVIKDDTKRISEFEYHKIRKELNDRTILVAINGTLGNVGLYNGEKIALGKSACYLNVKPQVNKYFIRYVLEHQKFQDYARLFATGSTIKNLGLKAVREYRFSLPELSIQDKIASILTAYDDLIENNLKRIKLLEELAQRTYEEWFVKFRVQGKQLPVNKKTGLPERWEKKKLNELIAYEIGGGWGEDEYSLEFSMPGCVVRGTDIDKLSLGDIYSVPHRFHKESNMASRKIIAGDIIFEVSGGSSNEGVGKTLLFTSKFLHNFTDDVMCASFCKLVRPIDTVFSPYLYLTLRYLRKTKTTEIWEIRSASNIVNYNWTAFLKYQDLIVPEKKQLEKFNKLASPVFDEIHLLGKQIRLLKDSRDILLPRLISGEIVVAEKKRTKSESYAF
jgi:type I restriction enzyme S subunit